MASITGAVGVAVEKFHQPIVGIVGYIQEGKLIKQCRMADRIKGFTEI